MRNLLLTACGPPALPDVELAHPEVSRITGEELKKVMGQKDGPVLVDTRSPGKFNKGHIKGAIAIPSTENEALVGARGTCNGRVCPSWCCWIRRIR